MKKYRYIILAAVILIFIGLTVLLWQPLAAFAQDPQQLKIWMKETGVMGALIFATLNAIQVIIAVIPGGPFEVAAGYVFGVLSGTLLCDVAMTTASVIVFLLVRRFGRRFVLLFFSQEQIDGVKFLKNTPKMRRILFFFFLIPGTPKDIITYLVGLTDLKLSTWILICFVGRFPAILLSALGGSALGSEKYSIVLIVIIVLVIAYLLGSWLYQRLNKNASKE